MIAPFIRSAKSLPQEHQADLYVFFSGTKISFVSVQ